METLDSILKRRSIRRFTDQAIPQADLELILKAGFNAPSAHRLHPLDYIIISEKERLNGMADLLSYGRPLRKRIVRFVLWGIMINRNSLIS